MKKQALFDLTFNQYSAFAKTTDVGDSAQRALGHKWLYYVLGINGESGELSEKVKKLFRDRDGVLDDEYRELILYEAGDILWYIDRLAKKLGSSLEEVALMNKDKLESRLDRGKLKGDGDKR